MSALSSLGGMKSLNPVIASRKTSIFEVMSRLAIEHEAINLGQGFPDEDGPEDIRRYAAEAAIAGPNQYPPMMGLPDLRQAVAESNRRHYGLDYDWREEVLVTAGATEALSGAFYAFLEPGDEVLVFQPAYDAYFDMVEGAGGVVRPVSLHPPDWSVDTDAVRQAIGPRTKALVLNTPLNPTGKVFTRTELEDLARFAEENDLIVISDEVYEHMCFDARPHVSIARLPGMKARTVRMGSAGKTFSLTGWKIGYSAGPKPLIEAMARSHQYLTFACPPPLQRAVAYGLRKEDAYFEGLAEEMQAKRDRFSAGLKTAGFDVLTSEGTYFLIADIAPLGFEDDEQFCRAITTEAGVAAVPVSAFYHHTADAPPRRYIRFCIAKQHDVLDAAAQRLKDWAER